MRMVIDGRAIATEIVSRTRAQIAARGTTPVVRAITIAPTPATESYLRIKSRKAQEAGMELVVEELPDTATTDDVIAAVKASGADAVIVQLPLPASIATESVLEAIPASQDADCLSRASREEGAPLVPPVAAAVAEICARAGVALADKRAVVVGSGWLVGAPVATYLRAQGAVVTVATRETENLETLLQEADVIVSGAGVAGLITPEHIRDGVVLIDAGTSESNGALRGDISPACAEKASVFTPVPGGVGPIAVACLFENVAILTLGKG